MKPEAYVISMSDMKSSIFSQTRQKNHPVAQITSFVALEQKIVGIKESSYLISLYSYLTSMLRERTHAFLTKAAREGMRGRRLLRNVMQLVSSLETYQVC